MLLTEIAAYLQTEGLGTLNTSIFFSLPSTPDNVTIIYQNPGERGIYVRGQANVILELPRFQIAVRDKSTANAYLRCERIYRALDGFKGTLSGVGYARIEALQVPFYLNTDESGRTSVTNNFRVLKEKSPIP